MAIDFDRVVLFFGTLLVAVALFISHLSARSMQALEGMQPSLPGALSNVSLGDPPDGSRLPANYWTHPETSPLQGVGLGLAAIPHPYSYPLGPVSAPGLIAGTD